MENSKLAENSIKQNLSSKVIRLNLCCFKNTFINIWFVTNIGSISNEEKNNFETKRFEYYEM